MTATSAPATEFGFERDETFNESTFIPPHFAYRRLTKLLSDKTMYAEKSKNRHCSYGKNVEN